MLSYSNLRYSGVSLNFHDMNPQSAVDQYWKSVHESLDFPFIQDHFVGNFKRGC